MKLTIGLVTMNRERQVAEAIQSCLQSNLPNETEFVVVNNASTDNTETVVKSILDLSGYPYVYYKTESNIGAGGGRTLYFEKSTGEYIYGMDDDAVVDFENNPDFFVKAIEILDGHQNIATLATQIYFPRHCSSWLSSSVMVLPMSVTTMFTPIISQVSCIFRSITYNPFTVLSIVREERKSE